MTKEPITGGFNSTIWADRKSGDKEIPKKLEEIIKQPGKKQDIFLEINEGKIDFEKWYGEYAHKREEETDLYGFNIGYFIRKGESLFFKGVLYIMYIQNFPPNDYYENFMSINYDEPKEAESFEKFANRFTNVEYALKYAPRKLVKVTEDEIKEIRMIEANNLEYPNFFIKTKGSKKGKYKGRLCKYCIILNEKEIPKSLKEIMQEFQKKKKISEKIIDEESKYNHNNYVICQGSNIELGYFKTFGGCCGDTCCTKEEEKFVTTISLKPKKETNELEISYDELKGGINIQKIKERLNQPKSKLIRLKKNKIIKAYKLISKAGLSDFLL